jgi:hypothetical protein
MKLSKKSKKLLSFFKKYNFINDINQTKKTDSILLELYHDIMEAYKYMLSLKSKSNLNNYKTSIKKINSFYEITKPKNFNVHSFPEEIRKNIDELSMNEISYTFSLFTRNIKIYFIVEEDNIEMKMDVYNKYVDSIIMWLYILNIYSSKDCASELVIYFYLTSHEKKLPSSNINFLDTIHVNTAFTTTCPKDSEIIIFRKEEWFKVFIHETFHNFGLDFSDMNTTECTKLILKLFPVRSQVNLYESYAECWAEIMNALFCSFYSIKDKNDVDDFLSHAEMYIYFEKTYSFFQMVKTLKFMGLTYKDLYSKKDSSKILRDTMYNENTNVLSYYIIKTILINNYQGFLSWCKSNNFSLMQFNKTISNQTSYCKFIERNSKTQTMLENVTLAEKLYVSLEKNNKKSEDYVLTNLRMSICELG